MNDYSDPRRDEIIETKPPQENLGQTTFRADDALPEVSPPTSKFLMQLFVIPFVIVAGAVLVVMIPKFLSHLDVSPDERLNQMAGGSQITWQTAYNLAKDLQDARQQHLRSDPKFAAQLVNLLEQQMKTETMDNDSIRLRSFLCRAIGLLEIEDGLPILLKASTTERQPEEIQVRIFAVEAIAQSIDNIGVSNLSHPEGVQQALLEAVKTRPGDQEIAELIDQLRSRGAFALGVLGSDESLEILANLTSDRAADVRYNAALGLARHGDERAMPVLMTMLDPSDLGGLEKTNPRFQEGHKTLVMGNGLKACILLAKQNEALDLTEMSQQVDQMLKEPLPLEVRDEALRLQKILRDDQSHRVRS